MIYFKMRICLCFLRSIKKKECKIRKVNADEDPCGQNYKSEFTLWWKIRFTFFKINKNISLTSSQLYDFHFCSIFFSHCLLGDQRSLQKMKKNGKSFSFVFKAITSLIKSRHSLSVLKKTIIEYRFFRCCFLLSWMHVQF